MFFFLSDSSLVGIYLEVVCEDCEIDLHIFHRTTLLQLTLFYHTVYAYAYTVYVYAQSSKVFEKSGGSDEMVKVRLRKTRGAMNIRNHDRVLQPCSQDLFLPFRGKGPGNKVASGGRF